MLYTHMYYKNQELQEALEDNELWNLLVQSQQ